MVLRRARAHTHTRFQGIPSFVEIVLIAGPTPHVHRSGLAIDGREIPVDAMSADGDELYDQVEASPRGRQECE